MNLNNLRKTVQSIPESVREATAEAMARDAVACVDDAISVFKATATPVDDDLTARLIDAARAAFSAALLTATPDPAPESEPSAPKRRGRPKGSRNKPKDTETTNDKAAE